MPRKPKRPCSYPGCPKLVEGQYCDEHKRLTDKQYNQYGRDEFTKNFYKTPEWRTARKQQLNSYPFCGDKFAPSNLQSLCWSCHSRKSVEEGSRFGRK